MRIGLPAGQTLTNEQTGVVAAPARTGAPAVVTESQLRKPRHLYERSPSITRFASGLGQGGDAERNPTSAMAAPVASLQVQGSFAGELPLHRSPPISRRPSEIKMTEPIETTLPSGAVLWELSRCRRGRAHRRGPERQGAALVVPQAARVGGRRRGARDHEHDPAEAGDAARVVRARARPGLADIPFAPLLAGI